MTRDELVEHLCIEHDFAEPGDVFRLLSDEDLEQAHLEDHQDAEAFVGSFSFGTVLFDHGHEDV